MIGETIVHYRIPYLGHAADINIDIYNWRIL
jgi:hypothetical protein